MIVQDASKSIQCSRTWHLEEPQLIPSHLKSGNALVDLLQMPGEEAPKAGSRVLCRHPFQVHLQCLRSVYAFWCRHRHRARHHQSSSMYGLFDWQNGCRTSQMVRYHKHIDKPWRWWARWRWRHRNVKQSFKRKWTLLWGSNHHSASENSDHFVDKTVLLRERKRHTARCVASTRSVILGGGGGGVPTLGGGGVPTLVGGYRP